MIRPRRFVYDAAENAVIEVVGDPLAPTFEQVHDRTENEYREQRSDRTAGAFRQATLERAARREFAHQRYGTESRWKE